MVRLFTSPGAAVYQTRLIRVLVNLLDNALRYASTAQGAILVANDVLMGQARLQVWSDGAPLLPATDDAVGMT